MAPFREGMGMPKQTGASNAHKTLLGAVEPPCSHVHALVTREAGFQAGFEGP